MFRPEVQIIGHEYLRNAMVNFDVLHREPFKTAQAAVPAQIETLRKQVAEEKDQTKKAVWRSN